MNLAVISGIITKDATVKGQAGFTSYFFQMENVTGYGDRKQTTIVNVYKQSKKDTMSKWLKKDRYVTVTGSLGTQSYQQNGATKSITVITAKDIELGGQKKDAADQTQDSGDPFGGASPSTENDANDNPFA